MPWLHLKDLLEHALCDIHPASLQSRDGLPEFVVRR